MASAECCNSVTNDGRTEQVPLLGERHAAVASTPATPASPLDTSTKPARRLEGVNTMANRPLNARVGHRLLLHLSNRSFHRGRLH